MRNINKDHDEDKNDHVEMEKRDHNPGAKSVFNFYGNPLSPKPNGNLKLVQNF